MGMADATIPDALRRLAARSPHGDACIKVWTLHELGRSGTSIAAELDVPVDTVRRWINLGLEDLQSNPVPTVPLDRERITDIRRHAVNLALDSEDPSTIRLGLEAGRDQARMDGLDAPQRVEQVQLLQLVSSSTIEELTNVLDDRLGRLARKGLLQGVALQSGMATGLAHDLQAENPMPTKSMPKVGTSLEQKAGTDLVGTALAPQQEACQPGPSKDRANKLVDNPIPRLTTPKGPLPPHPNPPSGGLAPSQDVTGQGELFHLEDPEG